MTQTISIPTPTELTERLSGVDALLTARRWERAAIVFAYTEVGEVGAGRFRKPAPPKLNIRAFAEQGFAGLTTTKAVSRYRQAWITAVSNGWATPVEPGDTVTLPEQPFPAWPYGAATPDDVEDEDFEDGPRGTLTEGGTVEEELVARAHRTWRPFEQRVLANLASAATSLRRLSDSVSTAEEELSSEAREQLVERLTELREEASTALLALQGSPIPV